MSFETKRVDFIHASGAKAMNGVLNNTITEINNSYPGHGLVTIADTAHGILAGSTIMFPDIASYDGLRLVEAIGGANEFDIRVDDAGGALANFTPAGTELWYVGQTYDETWELLGFKVTLSAASATVENFTIDVDAAKGSAFDWNVFTKDMNTVKDVIKMYEVPFVMNANDILKVNWANTNSRTWGVEILSRRLA